MVSDDLKTEGQNTQGESEAENRPPAAQMETAEVEETAEALLEKAQAEANEYLEGWQRARADFANYRKRVDRERQAIFQNATLTILTQLLPLLDDFERAMKNVSEDIEDHDWVKGIALIEQKLNDLLESHKLTVINPVGEVFDPSRHEAVGMDDSDEVESDHITVVLQQGYASGDKVLRPAIVRVAK